MSEKHAASLISQGKYQDALKILSDILATNDKQFDALIDSSVCHQRLKRYDLAIYHDLYLALRVAKEYTKLNAQLASVYFRLGVSYFKLKQFETSLKFFKLATQYDYQPSNDLTLWFAQLESKLKWDERTWKFFKELELDDKNIIEVLKQEAVEKTGKVPQFKKPIQKIEHAKNILLSNSVNQAVDATCGKTNEEKHVAKHTPEKRIPAVKQTDFTTIYPPPEQVKKDFFQSSDHITISFYIKKVPRESFKIDFKEKSLNFRFKIGQDKEYIYEIPSLFSEITPEKCSYTVFGTKVEVILAKKTPSTWRTLEANDAGDSSSSSNDSKNEESASQTTAYPSSSTKKINWEKLEKELGADTNNYDDDEADASMALFKQIYKDADDNTRRAMQKSFVESNGTTLSTNWDEVGKSPVKVSPPDGMETKYYES